MPRNMMLGDVTVSRLLCLLCSVFVCFITLTGGVEEDPKGYMVYCPCMGRFGNQADHFLGVLGFAKAIDRTLILPPWVEYHPPKPKSVQVPFDTYFNVDALREYHRVITMETFMKELAPTVWPPAERAVFCYSGRHGDKDNDCNAKNGNPFGPFWDTFKIDFVRSEFYQPLSFDSTNQFEMKRWKERYPPNKYKVLAFTGAPAHFPIQRHSLWLHKYVKWSDDITQKVDKFIAENLPGEKFLAIHLRLGSDFDKACDHVRDGTSNLFASAQCLGYNGEHGLLTREMCYPSYDTIAKQVNQAVKKMKVSRVFVATDSPHHLDNLSKKLKKVKLVKLQKAHPHVELAILARADHFICSCVSTFAAFAKRERDVLNKETEFWAFKKKLGHGEL